MRVSKALARLGLRPASHNPSPGSPAPRIATLSPKERAINLETPALSQGEMWSRVAGPGKGSLACNVAENLTHEGKFQTSSLLIHALRSWPVDNVNQLPSVLIEIKLQLPFLVDDELGGRK